MAVIPVGIAAVSDNHNGFGCKSVILVDKNKKAYFTLWQAYGPDRIPPIGTIIAFDPDHPSKLNPTNEKNPGFIERLVEKTDTMPDKVFAEFKKSIPNLLK